MLAKLKKPIAKINIGNRPNIDANTAKSMGEMIDAWVVDEDGLIRLGDKTLKEQCKSRKPFLLDKDNHGVLTPRQRHDSSLEAVPDGSAIL